MVSMDIRGPKHLICHGYMMPLTFSPDNFDSALEFHPKANTVFICTYPKCGTTWMQNIVYLLQHNGEPLPSHLKISDEIPWLEKNGSTYCENHVALKTHLPLHLLNWNDQAKYIVVARNPKDCCVSYYHHTRGFAFYDYAHGTFDDFFRRFINGEVGYGDFFDHFVSWQSRLNDRNVFFCTYEQLICDTKEIVKRLALFLEIKIDDNILEKVLQYSSLQAMQTDLQRWSIERSKDMPKFIRKGEIGDWRNYFNEEQSKLIDMKVEQFPLMKTLWAKYM
ncbi:unnamed protein product [Rotaria socialis]|uniref:Sulfotransferase domain-containing protein n=1 Tax=Rotaria socialis TaxID=392032 RepID=A0A817RWD5_9BILA|nr:unnamed protein product [Rotaria socialis]